jgi:hypothetical protein
MMKRRTLEMGMLVAGLAALLTGCGDLLPGACAWPSNGGDCENNTSASWCANALGQFYEGQSCSEAGFDAGCTPPLCAPSE